MSLPSVLTAWRDYVQSSIDAATGGDMPDRAIVHHGKLPDDCCSDAGTLAVWWHKDDLSVEFPLPLRIGGKAQVAGAFQLVDLGARLNHCWPTPEVADIGSDATYEAYQTTALALALVADEVSRDLLALTCGAATLGDGVVCEGVRWTQTLPDLSGDCAGVEWHVVVGLEGLDDGPT